MLITDVVAPGMSGPMLADKLTATATRSESALHFGLRQHPSGAEVRGGARARAAAQAFHHGGTAEQDCAATCPAVAQRREREAPSEAVIPSPYVTIRPASDRSLLVSFGDDISPAIASPGDSACSRALEGVRGILNLHPGLFLACWWISIRGCATHARNRKHWCASALASEPTAGQRRRAADWLRSRSVTAANSDRIWTTSRATPG